jgi:D-alanyl-D-alanine carboxypeptidase (penicillin-binding protein 5/6)
VRGRRRVQVLAAAGVTLATALAVAPAAPAAGVSALGAGSASRAAAAVSAPPAVTSAVPEAPAPPSLGARAAILVAQNTGQRLYGVNPDAELPIASTTKLMTALVTLERAPLSETFPYPNFAPMSPDASQIGLTPGERMSVRDLLVATMLPSADDAAPDLAYNIGGGSVARFVAMMNARATQLGLRHTHYSTPVGFDTPGNYSSASDLVKLAAYLLEHYPVFAQTVALPSAVLHTGNQARYVVSLNGLVGKVPWIYGVKTGHTIGAGYVLVAVARKGGLTLVSAVLGTASEVARDQNTLALLNWGYANFRLTEPVVGGSVLARPTVAEQPGKHATLIAAHTVPEVVARGGQVRVRLLVPHQVSGPLKQNTVVGRAIVLDDGRQLNAVPLILARAVPGVSALTLATRFITEPITLLGLVLLLGGTATLVVRRRLRRRARQPTAA